MYKRYTDLIPDTLSRRLCISYENLESLSGYISFNIGLINTKLENVPNLNMLFLTMWDSCCLSHNKRTRLSPSRFEIRQLSSYHSCVAKIPLN